MFKKIIQKFSIRKLSIGAVSVLLGTLFIGTSNSNAEAATVNNDGVEIQNEESNYESTAPVDENEGNDTQVAPDTHRHNGAIIESDGEGADIPAAVLEAHRLNPGAIIVANGNGEVTAEDNFDGGSIKPVLPSDAQSEGNNYESTAPVDENEGNDTQVAPDTHRHNGAMIEPDGEGADIPAAVLEAHKTNPGAIIVANGNGEVTAEDNFDGGSIKPVLPSDAQGEKNNYEPTAPVDENKGNDTQVAPDTHRHNGAIIEPDGEGADIPAAVLEAHKTNPGAIIVANGNGEVTAENNFDGSSIKPVLPSGAQSEKNNYEPTADSKQKTTVDETNSSEKTKLGGNTQDKATISTNNVNLNLHKPNNYPDRLSTKSEAKLPQTGTNKVETAILTTFGFIISIFGLADIRRKKN
jgi:hypothetical protein